MSSYLHIYTPMLKKERKKENFTPMLKKERKKERKHHTYVE